MITALERKSDGTLAITITIPWTRVLETKNLVVDTLIKEVEMAGFRKGHVPKETALKQLNAENVYEQVVQKLLPTAYTEAVSEHKLHPVVLPKIEIVQAKEENDWIMRATTAEKPSVTLGDYKKAIREKKAEKQTKIWTPADGPKAPDPDQDAKAKHMTLGELLEVLLGVVTCQIPDILVEHEVNQRLSELIDQTKKLGLTVDQYLSSTARTAESIRKEYADNARKTLSLEFALEAIGDRESIFISDDDIDAAIKSAKTDEERASLTKERYYLASILRRQKTLDFLSSL